VGREEKSLGTYDLNYKRVRLRTLILINFFYRNEVYISFRIEKIILIIDQNLIFVRNQNLFQKCDQKKKNINIKNIIDYIQNTAINRIKFLTQMTENK
jgi:hypothetical protein